MGIHVKSVKEDTGIEKTFLVFRHVELIEENGHMQFVIVFEIFDHLELANEWKCVLLRRMKVFSLF